MSIRDTLTRLLGRTQETESALTEAVAEAVERVLRDHAELAKQELGAYHTIADLNQQIAKAKAELSDLRVRRSEERREIEHKLGLHRARVEQDRELAAEKLEAAEERLLRMHEVDVREARVAAREEALAKADELLGEHVKRMESMVDILVGALPKAEILANISKG